ncbi:MAG: helix-turn-helix domain-containing protein [Polymorphobacter sp.]
MASNRLALIDTMLAFGSITLFMIGAALAVRDARRIIQGQLLIALLVSLTCLALTLAPGTNLLPSPLLLSARAIGMSNLGLLWWFCLSLLRDDFKIGRLEWAGFVAFTCVPAFYVIESTGISLPFSPTVNAYGSIPPVVMIGHVIWVALLQRNSDLVENRRTVRLWMAFAPLATLVISLVSESMDNAHLAAILRNGLGVIPVQLALLFWLTNLSPEQLQFKPVVKAVADQPRIDPKDTALHRRLMQAIEADQLYRRPGLSIDDLADLLKAPTHQLRNLINVGMGFRNFATFLNGYRLAHAKTALADIDRARDTILAIAYESGFASLQSFNRVFKDVVGQTPTEFRATAITTAAQN